ncbi:hypothetical protein EON81_22705 [bacterium]|nr:MAG: hypothetical protein EON81_22705 [bacterium]
MPERKDAVDAANQETKLESGVDQNRTKTQDVEGPGGQIPGSDQEPKNQIPFPDKSEKSH